MQVIEEQVVEERGLRKWFTRDNLIVMVLAGILLFVIAMPTKKQEESGQTNGMKNDVAQAETSYVESVETAGSPMGENPVSEDYGKALETKLEALLGAMSGVGEVEVMVTFASSEEFVVEKDAPAVRSNTVEQDSAGGNRTISQFETGDATVYRNVSGDSEPYVVKIITPRVEGVLVVAGGAGNSTVNKDIVEAVQALFGVEAHKVKVVSMGN